MWLEGTMRKSKVRKGRSVSTGLEAIAPLLRGAATRGNRRRERWSQEAQQSLGKPAEKVNCYGEGQRNDRWSLDLMA